MALKVLELEQLHLTSVADKLKLSMTSSAHLRMPGCISQLNQEETAKALASGDIWVSRGTSCGLDLHVSFDGKVVEGTRRIHVLESLGYRLRDAQLWSQLLLSPSLKIPDIEDPENSQLETSLLNPDLSIRLGHGRPPPDSTDPEVWLSSNIDLKPPGSILRAQLERLHLALDFDTHPKERRPKAKRVRTRTKAANVPDATLLHDATTAHDDHLRSFEDVVGKLSRSLSGSIASCFDRPQPPGFNQRPITDSSSQTPKTLVTSRSLGEVSLGANDALGGSPNVPTLDVPLDEDMLLSSDQDPSLLISSELTDEEMLFSQISESGPSISSQSTTVSTLSTTSTQSLTSSLKRSFPSGSSIAVQAEVPSPLDVSLACKFAETALRILIGGYAPRRTRLLGVRIDKPPPETSLSDLAPGLFNPDFKVSMSHNARYLPTISHAFASWPQNVQSPILKRKLFQLAYSPPSTLDPGGEDTSNHEAATDPIMSVVQARLWAMMQRKLYDRAAARAAFNPRSSDKAPAELVDEDRDEDLLAGQDTEIGNVAERSMMDDLLDFMKDEFGDEDGDEFEDLLGGGNNEEDDLLGYMDASERERLEVEHETYEMLFGTTYEEDLEADDEDMLFLEAERENESMLL